MPMRYRKCKPGFSLSQSTTVCHSHGDSPHLEDASFLKTAPALHAIRAWWLSWDRLGSEKQMEFLHSINSPEVSKQKDREVALQGQGTPKQPRTTKCPYLKSSMKKVHILIILLILPSLLIPETPGNRIILDRREDLIWFSKWLWTALKWEKRKSSLL